VSSSEARRAVVASGLPLSVGVVAFNQLGVFREMIDRFLSADPGGERLGVLVREFESWARENAIAITEGMPNQELLDSVRPQWLKGTPLCKIIETCGEVSGDICTDFYGYKLSWLFHSIAQKLDKVAEEKRTEALSMVGLLIELGVPNEAAAKVFLAGVRSRSAAVELGVFVTNPSASVLQIRNALLDQSLIGKLSQYFSPSTLEWLNLLFTESRAAEVASPCCSPFRLEVPDEIDMIHVRQVAANTTTFLCSTDGRFKYAVASTHEMPFNKLANDFRFVFVRDGNVWRQQCRDPRVGLDKW